MLGLEGYSRVAAKELGFKLRYSGNPILYDVYPYELLSKLLVSPLITPIVVPIYNPPYNPPLRSLEYGSYYGNLTYFLNSTSASYPEISSSPLPRVNFNFLPSSRP